jgi:hypothetical protein
LLKLPRGNYLIVVTRGLIDANGLEQIFRKVATTVHSLPDCKVLMDLADSSLRLGPLAIAMLVDGLGPDLLRPSIKIAVVSPTKIHEFEQLRMLCASLGDLGLKVAVLDNPKDAVAWLGDGS